MTVRFAAVARTELRAAIRYYESKSPGLGRELVAEVRATVERIKAMPEAWHPVSENSRRCRTRRFPYGVIYRLKGDDIYRLSRSRIFTKTRPAGTTVFKTSAFHPFLGKCKPSTFP